MLFCCTLSEQELISKDEHIEKCIRKLAQGDINALDGLYKLISTDVYAFALSKTQSKSDAEDIMQDTFVQIYKYAKSYVPQGKPMAWIFTIVSNYANRKFELRSRDAFIDDQDLNDAASEDSFEGDVETRQFLLEIMKILSVEEQEIIVLHIVSGLKHKEIADVLGLKLSTVLSKYNRAMKKMKAYVEEAGNDK